MIKVNVSKLSGAGLDWDVLAIACIRYQKMLKAFKQEGLKSESV
jgi:hypothetical protein